MALDNKQTRLTAIYKQLYQYRHLLKGAPPLTIDLDVSPDSQISDGFSRLNEELNNVIGFLLGLPGSSLAIKTMIEALNKHYKKDDFWRYLLLDFIEIKQETEEENIAMEKKSMQDEGLDLYAKLREFQKRRKEIVDSFSEKMAAEKFPLDTRRLFKNYLNMADLDKEEAWRVLCTNPAFFSPLIVEDEKGKRLFSIKEAKEMNKKIGAFIQKLRA